MGTTTGKHWKWRAETFSKACETEKRKIMEHLLVAIYMVGEPIQVSKLFEEYDNKVVELERATQKQYKNRKRFHHFLHAVKELRDVDMRFDLHHKNVRKENLKPQDVSCAVIVPLKKKEPYILGNGGSDTYA